MSLFWARATLTAYRWLGGGIYPFLGSYLAFRATKGKEEHSRRRERYGHPSAERPEGPLIWAHAASVGETTAVIPLIEELLKRGISVVLTTGTVTSAAVASERLGDRVIHQYVPLDLKPAVSRFLDYWKPDLAIMAESEIWPMTILELGARRMPQVLVNGRLSDKSFANWRRRPHLAEALFENLSMVIAQSEEDAERFRALGARPVAVSGNLKVDTKPLACDETELRRLGHRIGERGVWAAVSTHPGEEAIAADVHQSLKPRHKALTVIVPRHPERADEVEDMLASRGLAVARRSRGDVITSETQVYLGDTIGEMGLYLRMARIAFVGGSLTWQGGHNPLEPAMLDCAILSGRNVQNFRDSYRSLLKNGGARLVNDGETLTKLVEFLLSNRRTSEKMRTAALKTVEELSGALPRTVRTLEPYIKPLTVKAELYQEDSRIDRW